MSKSETTERQERFLYAPGAIPNLVREAWCDGYQEAINALRRWAVQFANDQTKSTIIEAAGMIELAKPNCQEQPMPETT